MALHRPRQTNAEWPCRAPQRRMRDDLLNEPLFLSLDHARDAVAASADGYNMAPLRSSLGYRRPAEHDHGLRLAAARTLDILHEEVTDNRRSLVAVR